MPGDRRSLKPQPSVHCRGFIQNSSLVEYRAVHAHHPPASALTWDGRCTWWERAPWSTTEREMSRSVADRQDDTDHVAWWLDAAGTFVRSRLPGRRGRLGEPDQLAELALPARPARQPTVPGVWRAEAGELVPIRRRVGPWRADRGAAADRHESAVPRGRRSDSIRVS
jgi:hypothetical protein